MTIQEQLDAVSATGGGKVHVPAGDYRSQGRILIPSNVELIGSGPACTTIKSVGTKQPTVTADGRRYWIGIEGFCVYGDNGEGTDGYIGVDFRQVSTSYARRLYIVGFKTGLLLSGAGCYYNLIDSVFTDCSVDGIELYNAANQNTILNCKPSAPISIYIMDSNGTTIIGGSGEGTATQGNFIKQSGETTGTAVKGFRGESTNFGPVWCNADNLSGNF